MDVKSREAENRLAVYRDYKIVKSNTLIQKARFQLSMQEQKIILYLISKIKPQDLELREHVFKVKDFCGLCGLNSSGANYEYIKKTLKGLRDKSVWITLDNGSETTLSWLDYVTISPKSGAVAIKISEIIKPYLLQLHKQFTQYEVLYILAMKSQYSIRLYELLKSYEFRRSQIFETSDLKKILSAESYKLFGNFKQKVLDIALHEINALSDISVTYDVIKEGRAYTKIVFYIKLKEDVLERSETVKKIYDVIYPPQLSMLHKEPDLTQYEMGTVDNQ